MPDEVIVSNEELKVITHAYLYETCSKKRKKRLGWLLLLYNNSNVADLAKKLRITKEELLDALKEL